MKKKPQRRDSTQTGDRIRWWFLKRICPKVNRIELLGYTAMLAGYSDYPTLDDERFEVYSPGHSPPTQSGEGG